MYAILDRVEQDLIDLGRSIHTREGYLGALRRLQRWHGTPLDELGPEEVQAYMRHLPVPQAVKGRLRRQLRCCALDCPRPGLRTWLVVWWRPTYALL